MIARFLRWLRTSNARDIDARYTRDLLIAAGSRDAYGVTVGEILDWTDEERVAVSDWAVAVRLRASNPRGHVPQAPAVIRARYTEFVARRYEGS